MSEDRPHGSKLEMQKADSPPPQQRYTQHSLPRSNISHHVVGTFITEDVTNMELADSKLIVEASQAVSAAMNHTIPPPGPSCSAIAISEPHQYEYVEIWSESVDTGVDALHKLKSVCVGPSPHVLVHGDSTEANTEENIVNITLNVRKDRAKGSVQHSEAGMSESWRLATDLARQTGLSTSSFHDEPLFTPRPYSPSSRTPLLGPFTTGGRPSPDTAEETPAQTLHEIRSLQTVASIPTSTTSSTFNEQYHSTTSDVTFPQGIRTVCSDGISAEGKIESAALALDSKFDVTTSSSSPSFSSFQPSSLFGSSYSNTTVALSPAFQISTSDSTGWTSPRFNSSTPSFASRSLFNYPFNDHYAFETTSTDWDISFGRQLTPIVVNSRSEDDISPPILPHPLPNPSPLFLNIPCVSFASAFESTNKLIGFGVLAPSPSEKHQGPPATCSDEVSSSASAPQPAIADAVFPASSQPTTVLSHLASPQPRHIRIKVRPIVANSVSSSVPQRHLNLLPEKVNGLFSVGLFNPSDSPDDVTPTKHLEYVALNPPISAERHSIPMIAPELLRKQRYQATTLKTSTTGRAETPKQATLFTDHSFSSSSSTTTGPAPVLYAPRTKFVVKTTAQLSKVSTPGRSSVTNEKEAEERRREGASGISSRSTRFKAAMEPPPLPTHHYARTSKISKTGASTLVPAPPARTRLRSRASIATRHLAASANIDTDEDPLTGAVIPKVDDAENTDIESEEANEERPRKLRVVVKKNFEFGKDHFDDCTIRLRTTLETYTANLLSNPVSYVPVASVKSQSAPRHWIPGLIHFDNTSTVVDSVLPKSYSLVLNSNMSMVTMEVSMNRLSLKAPTGITKSSLRNGSGSTVTITLKGPRSLIIHFLAMPTFFFPGAIPQNFRPMFQMEPGVVRTHPAAYLAFSAIIPGSDSALVFDWTMIDAPALTNSKTDQWTLVYSTRILSFNATVQTVGGKLERDFQTDMHVFNVVNHVLLLSGACFTKFNLDTQKSATSRMPVDEQRLLNHLTVRPAVTASPSTNIKVHILHGVPNLTSPKSTPSRVSLAELSPVSSADLSTLSLTNASSKLYTRRKAKYIHQEALAEADPPPPNSKQATSILADSGSSHISQTASLATASNVDSLKSQSSKKRNWSEPTEEPEGELTKKRKTT